MGEGNCLKYLKRGWNRKERGSKNFKKEGKLSQGVGALKKGGQLEPSYKLCVSSTNNLAVDEIPLIRSLMCIKKNKSPKIESCGTPASTGVHA